VRRSRRTPVPAKTGARTADPSDLVHEEGTPTLEEIVVRIETVECEVKKFARTKRSTSVPVIFTDERGTFIQGTGWVA
jgi:hypothetical protein